MDCLSSLQRAALDALATVAPQATPAWVMVGIAEGPPLFVSLSGLARGSPSSPDGDFCDYGGEGTPAEDTAPAQKIIEVLAKASRPMKARAIAKAAGLSYTSSYFRQAMAKLVREIRVVKPDPAQSAYFLPNK